jgi:clan AA aspartic protease (TIGR02281 family)
VNSSSTSVRASDQTTRRRFVRLPILIGLSIAICPCPAEVYRWVDGSGRVNYSDKEPGLARRAEIVEIATKSGNGALAQNTARISPAAGRSAANTSEQPQRMLLAASSVVRLSPDETGIYWADGTINGKKIRFVVDTGASTIALNREHARALGIEVPKTTRQEYVMTASGLTRVRYVKLRDTRVGNVVVRDVLASVTEDGYPTEPLLGMTFLSQVHLVQRDRVLEIRLP